MHAVTLPEMLSAREERCRARGELREQTGLPSVTLTLNIAGPFKRDRTIDRAFEEALSLLHDVLAMRGFPAVKQRITRAETGNEAILAVRADAETLKRLCCEIEELPELGRVLDLDVHDADGTPLSRTELGYAPRRCLLCGEDAHSCARSRTHSPEELSACAHARIERYFTEKRCRFAAACAERALLYEVSVTPKPGLVDRENNGAHPDMDFSSFLRSAAVLTGYFYECARLGAETEDTDALRAALVCRGLLAEAEMRRAAGANTHKGAIFSLGLLCAAAGAERTAGAIRTKAAALAAPRLAEVCGGAGRGGVTGARGEAAAGFPHVFKTALPVLERELDRGRSENDAAALALLALIAEVDDSNMICRSDRETAETAKHEAKRLLESDPTMDDLRELDRRFTGQNLSPGGSADLLAIAFFFRALEEENG